MKSKKGVVVLVVVGRSRNELGDLLTEQVQQTRETEVQLKLGDSLRKQVQTEQVQKRSVSKKGSKSSEFSELELSQRRSASNSEASL